MRRSPAGHGVRDRRAGGPDAVAHRRGGFGGSFLSRFLRDAGTARGVKSDKVYLVGFMAAGKSSLARALAKRLDWQALDIDVTIERRERLTVREVFARQGEA